MSSRTQDQDRLPSYACYLEVADLKVERRNAIMFQPIDSRPSLMNIITRNLARLYITCGQAQVLSRADYHFTFQLFSGRKKHPEYAPTCHLRGLENL